MEINLNLIPPYRKEEIAAIKFRRFFLLQLSFVLLVIFIFALILLIFNEILKIEDDSISYSNLPVDKIRDLESLERYDEQFKNANSEIVFLNNIKKENFYWSSLFMELNNTVPESIEIKNVYTKKNQIFISGIADSRDNLVFFEDNLKKNKCFDEINLPLSNFASKENIDFQISFFIKESCIKK
jgi:Tfp pilus assembly protein PilN